MAFVLKDRVKETSTTTGTGTFSLGGASPGYQGFSTIGNANTTFYSIVMGTEWENGVGTYTSSGSALSRDTVLSSSNSGSLVNFSAGTKDVFVNYPAGRAAAYDTPSQSTGSFVVPVGTTAQRPASPVTGMVRYNTTESKYEAYNGTDWVIVDTLGYSFSADFLVVAGGGGGGSGGGAGGGAGGYRTSYGTSGGGGSAESALTLLASTNYTVTVGSGGAGGSGSGYNKGTNGSNSVFSTITATGGGGGGAYQVAPNTGGSGGGGEANLQSGAAGTANQGYRGGNKTGGNFSGAGGGGAGATGTDSSSSGGTTGGTGVASTITGSSVTYGGGGGGGAQGSYGGGSAANGGSGGGGNGGSTTDGSNGTANTGGGAGGGGYATNSLKVGGTGGSGVVIIRYPDTRTLSNPGGGLTYSTATSGLFKVTTFTAGTGSISFS